MPTVACASVHDSSCLREWWEKEVDRDLLWRFVGRSLGRDLGPAPVDLVPGAAAAIMETVARSASLIAVYPIQDLLALVQRYRSGDPSEERINIPGTVGGRNWVYRMPVALDDLAGDTEVAGKVRALASSRGSVPE